MMNIPGRANIWTGRYKKVPSALSCYAVLFGFLLLNTNGTNPLYLHQKGHLAKWCVFWQRIIGSCCCLVLAHLHQGEGRHNLFPGTRGKQPKPATVPSVWATPVLQYMPANWAKCLCCPRRGPLSWVTGKCMARCYSEGTEMLWTCFQLSLAHVARTTVYNNWWQVRPS